MLDLLKNQLTSPTTLTGSGIALLILWLAIGQPLWDGKEPTWPRIVVGGIAAALVILFAVFVPDRSDIQKGNP